MCRDILIACGSDKSTTAFYHHDKPLHIWQDQRWELPKCTFITKARKLLFLAMVIRFVCILIDLGKEREIILPMLRMRGDTKVNGLHSEVWWLTLWLLCDPSLDLKQKDSVLVGQHGLHIAAGSAFAWKRLSSKRISHFDQFVADKWRTKSWLPVFPNSVCSPTYLTVH